jgi:hypothetical protein
MRPSVGRGEIPSLGGVAERQAKGRGDARAIGGIGLGTVAEMWRRLTSSRASPMARAVFSNRTCFC